MEITYSKETQMPKVSIDVNINTDEDEMEDALDDPSLKGFLSDLSNSIVEIVNAKEGIYGSVNFFLNGEEESTANFD